MLVIFHKLTDKMSDYWLLPTDAGNTLITSIQSRKYLIVFWFNLVSLFNDVVIQYMKKSTYKIYFIILCLNK